MAQLVYRPARVEGHRDHASVRAGIPKLRPERFKSDEGSREPYTQHHGMIIRGRTAEGGRHYPVPGTWYICIHTWYTKPGTPTNGRSYTMDWDRRRATSSSTWYLVRVYRYRFPRIRRVHTAVFFFVRTRYNNTPAGLQQ